MLIAPAFWGGRWVFVATMLLGLPDSLICMTLTWHVLLPFFHEVEMPVKTQLFFDLDVIV